MSLVCVCRDDIRILAFKKSVGKLLANFMCFCCTYFSGSK